MKPKHKLEVLLFSNKVSKAKRVEVIEVDKQKVEEAYEAIKSGEYILKQGIIYLLVDGDSKEIVIGNGEVGYDEAYVLESGQDISDFVTEEDLDEKLEDYDTSAEVDSKLEPYATEEWVEDQNYLTEGDLPTPFSGSYNDLSNVPSSFPSTVAQVDGLQTELDGKASTDVATDTSDGLMSSSDKDKLNGVAEGATNYNDENVLSALQALDGYAEGATLTVTAEGISWVLPE